MPRVLPSDVVKLADRMFSAAPTQFPTVEGQDTPRYVALARLAEAVPTELLTLEPSEYAGLLASVSYLTALGGGAAFHMRSSVSLHLSGYDKNPVALIRDALAKCPDEAPAAGTTALAFIADEGLRESIRLDMSAAARDKSAGEWKGATVLGGSAVEALLLWALQDHEARAPQSVHTAVRALVPKILNRDPGSDLEGPNWHLHEYVEVAAHLNCITDDTASLVRVTKNYRNLIHPGRAARLQQKCDRSTALAALAAAEAVARDLEAWAVSSTP